MAISQTIGVNMPDDFPTTAHNAVHVKLIPCQPRVEWTQYAGGWNAIAFRFKTITVIDETFTVSIRHSPRPSFDEYQVQEEALFGFFVTGYAVIESFSYALFALGAMLRHWDFPMQPRRINPTSTQKKFATHFAGTPVEAALSALVTNSAYKQWGCIRNVLAHRTAPSRNYFVSLQEGHHGVPPDDPDTVWQIIGGLPLNEQTTSGKRAWLARHLTECVQATKSFVNAQFP